MLDELSNAPCPAICKPVNIARAAKRLRQRLSPEDLKDLDFEIDEDCVPPGFFQADVKRKDERHLIFVREEQLETLARAKSWYVDKLVHGQVGSSWYATHLSSW